MSAMVEFLRARLDEDEAAAEAARRQVAERACPLPQVDEWAARAGHWGVVPWLYLGRAEADLAQWGRVEIAVLAKDHIARHDPARVLAEVAAKRERIRLWDNLRVLREGGGHEYDLAYGAASKVLQFDAAVHSEHPDYMKEWAP